GAALYRYWDMRANWREPIGYLENLLRQPEAAARTIARANVLLVLAVMEMFLGKYPLSGQHLEETIEIAREQGERGKPLLAESLAHYSDIAFYPTLDVWQ